jgi:hypothetical protein
MSAAVAAPIAVRAAGQVGPKPTPASFALAGVRASGNVELVQKKTPVRNVMAYLPGKQANEYVVVGAHYDHLGRGAMGSLRRPSEKTDKDTIHNGADDNASGTTAMLALASQMRHEGKPDRSIIFIAFFMRHLGKYGWAKIAAVSVGTMTAFFLMFEIWFKVPLPKGPIEALLGFQ